MAPAQNIAIIGAGSLRCAGPVLASLFNFQWPPGSRLMLCDIHEEALDLYDRLARAFAATQDTDLLIQSTSELAEALFEADIVILSFGLGHADSERQAQLGAGPECDELVRGVMLHHTFERVNERLFALDPPADVVINLVSPVGVSQQLLATEAIHLDWPRGLADEGRVPAAHRALRIVRGEELPLQEIRQHAASPLLTALLDRRPAPENRFNPVAVAGWLERLEAAMPGCREVLMDQR